MKKTLTSLVALGALFTLAACGSSSQDTKKSTELTTKTFHALNGDVKVPTHPERIAVQNYPDEVASIGGNVVGTDSWAYPNPFLSKEQNKNMVDLGSPKFNIEKLTAQNPDLIITVDKDQVADYQKIAPTVLVNYQELSTMDKSLDYFAELLNMEDGKDEFLKSFKKESIKEVAKLKDAGIDPSKKTISILELQGNKIYAYGSNFGRGGQALTTGLGFKQSEKMTALTNGTGYAEVNAESLGEFDADYIFVDFASTDKSQYEALQKNPVWTKMNAVKAGHVITMDYNKVYFYSGPTATERELSLYADAISKEN